MTSSSVTPRRSRPLTRPTYRNALLHRLEIANDPRTERYLNLLHLINGLPTHPSLSPIFDWFISALRSHPSSS
jgi:hypothetical protein